MAFYSTKKKGKQAYMVAFCFSKGASQGMLTRRVRVPPTVPSPLLPRRGEKKIQANDFYKMYLFPPPAFTRAGYVLYFDFDSPSWSPRHDTY